MRILLLAPVHREKEFLEQKEKLPFLKGQGQQSWAEALEELGHEVAIFRYTDSYIIPQDVKVWIVSLLEKVPKYPSFQRRITARFYKVFPEYVMKNRKLIELSQKVKPEVVILSGGTYSVFPETLDFLKRKFHSKVLLFSGINPQIAATIPEKEMVAKGVIDTVIDNDMGYARAWKKFGAKKTIVLPISSVDPKLHRKIRLTDREKKEFGADVCFVGSLLLERQEILKELVNFDLKIWGDVPTGVGLMRELKPYYQGMAYGEKMVKIFNASKIVLNFQPQDMESGGNMRTFEILGCGAFALADKVNQEWFRNGKDLVIFKDVKDLREKILYYLKYERERKKITENGYHTAHSQHTYASHFKKLIELVKNL